MLRDKRIKNADYIIDTEKIKDLQELETSYRNEIFAILIMLIIWLLLVGVILL